MELQIGDRVRYLDSTDIDVVREILEVRKTGYTWRYPGGEPATLANTWISENSNDPFFDWHWELIDG